jgi:lactonase
LQTVIAEPWFKVTEQRMVLEGPCIDRNGNLLFSEASGGRVLRLTPDRSLSTVFSKSNLVSD